MVFRAESESAGIAPDWDADGAPGGRASDTALAVVGKDGKLNLEN